MRRAATNDMERRSRHRGWRFAAIFAVILCGGCVSLAKQVTQPHTPDSRARRLVHDIERERLHLETQSVRARNGNRIAYRLLPAADYHLAYEYSRKSHSFSAKFDWGEPTPVNARGSIVFLHGWGEDHSMMMMWSLAMARYGYQGVLPDLRNFGASDRAPVGFGPREAEDIVDLLKALRDRGQLQRPVFLFGASYGATVAINAASQAPELVDGVVAMEPFVDAASAIRGFVRESKSPRSSINGKAFAFYARHAFTDARVDKAIAESGTRLGIDLANTGIRAPLRDNRVCTLLLQGGRDEFLKASDVRALQGSPQVRYAELPNESHLTLPLRIDLLAAPVSSWLQDIATCPSFTAPAEPPQVP